MFMSMGDLAVNDFPPSRGDAGSLVSFIYGGNGLGGLMGG